MVDGARLESVYTGNRIVGSNPTFTASFRPRIPETCPRGLIRSKAPADGRGSLHRAKEAAMIENLRVHGASVVAAALLLAACQSGPPASGEAEAKGWPGAAVSADPAQIEAGKAIAEKQCAQCHAIDRASRSTNPAAPPLRDVLAVNDADNLAYRFIEAMRVGHDEMPVFDFDVRAADALVAYIASISG